jgi:hypothetical protein
MRLTLATVSLKHCRRALSARRSASTPTAHWHRSYSRTLHRASRLGACFGKSRLHLRGLAGTAQVDGRPAAPGPSVDLFTAWSGTFW